MATKEKPLLDLQLLKYAEPGVCNVPTENHPKSENQYTG